MYEFNKKQKIIIVIIFSIIIIAFLYYIYTKDKSTFISSEELEVENTTEEETEEVEEESQKIIVHVSGAVNKEGIVKLDADSRISDAIDKAEGLAENADTKKINLAFKLEDGMKIYIPKIGEEENEETQETTGDETSQYITSSSGVIDTQENESSKNSSGKITKGKININTASQTELETLPGIGPATSSKIISYREENGKFESIEEIKEVSGIGDAKYENIKELICVK